MPQQYDFISLQQESSHTVTLESSFAFRREKAGRQYTESRCCHEIVWFYAEKMVCTWWSMHTHKRESGKIIQ